MGVEDESVRSLVHHPPVVVDADTPLRAVAEILAEESVGAALVHRTLLVEGKVEHLEGLISERDISHAIAAGLDPDATQAADVMTMDLASANTSETILRSAERMLAYGIRHLPISDDGAVIGVVSERDVMRALVQEVQRQIRR